MWIVDRYRKIGYGEGLANAHRYPIVCKELSSILREAYQKFPKDLQSVILDDTLAAFRLLPLMQNQSAVSAAHLLFQSAEAVLPKQKKNLAASEFKRANVAHKRRWKSHRYEEITSELPEDVLSHVFSFLDTQSLASVGNVCRSWNVAARNNLLWQAHYAKIFGGDVDSEGPKTTSAVFVPEDTIGGSSADWKEAFKRAFTRKGLKRLASSRGYCNSCRTIVWVDCMKCCNEANHSSRRQIKNTQITHMTSRQIIEYLLHGSSSLLSSSSDCASGSDEEFPFNTSSDSDGDSDDWFPIFTLWTYHSTG